ncbi:MAG: prevent-host-death protein [Firmicutes bacterium HGW-Firmicutes-1]|jgi:Uma2 family endonuclease|nr:MAG: prevent-host-death protein [Firmicutes bacterium HGW-Firmicutes-1]
MILNATEIKNSFGKMLKLLDYEDIMIKKNGRIIAKVTKFEEPLDPDDLIKEQAVHYEPKDRKVSYEEFLKLTAASEQRYELIDGHVYLLASPKVTHQMITGQLYGQLFNHFVGKKCQPFVSPFDITLVVDKKKNVVQPDLGIICDMETGTDEKDSYMGIPSLVVEVLSQSSVTKDMVGKLQVYMLAGVKEYWVVNPMKASAMVYGFKDYEIIFHRSMKKEEGIESYLFPDLKVTW